MKPPAISTKLWMNTQVRPASQAWIGSLVASLIGSITTNVTTNMCGTLMPEGSAQTSVRPVLLRQVPGEERVVSGAEEQHQPERRQDAAEHQRVRHFQHEAQQAGQHQHVDQDVGAEAEQGVPVAGHPELWPDCRLLHFRSFCCSLHHVLARERLDDERRWARPSRRCRPVPRSSSGPSRGTRGSTSRSSRQTTRQS